MHSRDRLHPSTQHCVPPCDVSRCDLEWHTFHLSFTWAVCENRHSCFSEAVEVLELRNKTALDNQCLTRSGLCYSCCHNARVVAYWPNKSKEPSNLIENLSKMTQTWGKKPFRGNLNHVICLSKCHLLSSLGY